MDEFSRAVRRAARCDSWDGLTVNASQDRWVAHFVRKAFFSAGNNALYLATHRSVNAADFCCPVPAAENHPLRLQLRSICAGIGLTVVEVENMGFQWSMNILPVAQEQDVGAQPSSRLLAVAASRLQRDPAFFAALARMTKVFQINKMLGQIGGCVISATMLATAVLYFDARALVSLAAGAVGLWGVEWQTDSTKMAAVAQAQTASLQPLLGLWCAAAAHSTCRLSLSGVAVALLRDKSCKQLVATPIERETDDPIVWSNPQKDHATLAFIDRQLLMPMQDMRGLFMELASDNPDLAGTRLLIAALPRAQEAKPGQQDRPKPGGGANRRPKKPQRKDWQLEPSFI